MSEIPQETEACSNWVYRLYEEKDKIYDYFVQHGTFEGRGLPRTEIVRNYSDLFIELSWILIIGVPSLVYLFKFLWTSSVFVQLILIILICLGKTKDRITEGQLNCVFFLRLATIGVRAMIAVTETEHGSEYGETRKYT